MSLNRPLKIAMLVGLVLLGLVTDQVRQAENDNLQEVRRYSISVLDHELLSLSVHSSTLPDLTGRRNIYNELTTETDIRAHRIAP